MPSGAVVILGDVLIRLVEKVSLGNKLYATIKAIDNAASYYIVPFFYTLGSVYLP